MVQDVLELSAELEVDAFSEFEVLAQIRIHLNESRALENVSSQNTETLERSCASWVRRVAKQSAGVAAQEPEDAA